MCFDSKTEVEQWTIEEARWKTGNQMFQRKEDFNTYYYYYEDILRVIRGYPDVQFRFVVTPSSDLPSSFFPIYATQEEIKYQMKLGEEDAKNIIYEYLGVNETKGSMFNASGNKINNGDRKWVPIIKNNTKNSNSTQP